jgi:CheY-like chemotaxis protein
MSTRKILLVDDSKSARYALRLSLQRHDCEVDTADSAESGLEKIKQDLPDAIFMDHLMPGMNGFEALDLLKADPRTAHIPVVMCTSNDDEPYRRQAQEKGALGTLPKPTNPDKLKSTLEAIDSAIAEALAAAAPAPVAEPEPLEEEIVLQAPIETPMAPDEDQIRGMVADQVEKMLAREIKPLMEKSIASSIPSLKAELSESLMRHAAEQISQSLNAEMAMVRRELTESKSDSGLAQKVDEDMRQLKNELIKMETEHAQTVANKLSHEVLPELIGKQAALLEQQLSNRFDDRFEQISQQLLREIPSNNHFIRTIAEIAETSAEQKAVEIATAHAHDIAISAAEERAGEVTDTLIHSAETAVRRMYVMAGLAAASGIGAAAAVYFLLV